MVVCDICKTKLPARHPGLEESVLLTLRETCGRGHKDLFLRSWGDCCGDCKKDLVRRLGEMIKEGKQNGTNS